ncbi:MAG: CC_3452 family protein [Caulobacteraceae bacterium]
MKVAFAAACFIASLSLATNALADGRTTATLQHPVSKDIHFVARGALWYCEGTTCLAGLTPDETFGVAQCRDVSTRAGPVSEFKDEARSLDSTSLEKCNAGVKVRGG